jgi:hypothetical protein
MAETIINFDSLIITPIRLNNKGKESSYMGKVDYLIKGDIRYSTGVSTGEDSLGFTSIYEKLAKYVESILSQGGGEMMKVQLGTIIFTTTTVTIRLAGSQLNISNSGPRLRQRLSSFNKVSFSAIDGEFESVVQQFVLNIDTRAREELSAN